jgi:hypothetical protein
MEGHHRIVGFEVEPYSIAEGANRLANDPGSEPLDQRLLDNGDISFSYRIITRRDPSTTWSNRLDHYIKTGDNNIHMANIIYTACAAITLVIVLMLVLERSLSRDFSKLEILKTSRR